MEWWSAILPNFCLVWTLLKKKETLRIRVVPCWCYRGAEGPEIGRVLPRADSFLVLIILAAYSWPVHSLTHLRTTEKAPLWNTKKQNPFVSLWCICSLWITPNTKQLDDIHLCFMEMLSSEHLQLPARDCWRSSGNLMATVKDLLRRFSAEFAFFKTRCGIGPMSPASLGLWCQDFLLDRLPRGAPHTVSVF